MWLPARRQPLGRLERTLHVARDEAVGSRGLGNQRRGRSTVLMNPRTVVCLSPPIDARVVDPAGVEGVRRLTVADENDAAQAGIGNCKAGRYFFSFAPVSCPNAPSVVCAAFSPRRKSLSLNVEYRSVG